MKLLNKFLTQFDKKEESSTNLQHQDHNVNYRKGNVPFQAYIRVRPLFLHEQIHISQPSIEVLDRESVIFKHEHQQGLKSLTKDKLYRCTRTVPPGSKTPSIFQSGMAEQVIESFRGLNQALFLIGGKDAGKTHTFIGNVGDPGLSFLIPRTLFQLKDRMFSNSKIYLSCFSFGNGFTDLLTYTGEYLEHKSTSNGSYLPGLTQVECTNFLVYLTHLKMALVVDGKRDINRDFSQSFTLFKPALEKEIFIIKLTIVNISEETNKNNEIVVKETTSDLFLIDTQSYEFNEKTNLKGVNNAMLAFDNCIRALYEINMDIREDFHVPYEQSPFTSFFREYLGGRSKTYIIGAVSPYGGHLEFSMRTVREVQWACKSKSTEVRQKNLVGNQKLALEVGYLKVMNNESILISQDLISYLKRKDFVDEEEKLNYVEILSKIFKKCYFINRLYNEKQKKVLEQVNAIIELQNEIMELQKIVLKEQIRSIDIKEFFIIKVMPMMFNCVYTQIQKNQQLLAKKLKVLKQDCLVTNRIKKDFKEYIETQVKNNPQIKQSHSEAVAQFTKAMIDHTNWSQSNFYKTFNDPQKIKIAQDKLKVEKTFDSNCKRIFISLKITDEDHFEDKSFAYAGIKFFDEGKQKEKKKSNLVPRGTRLSLSHSSRGSNFKQSSLVKLTQESESSHRLSSLFEFPPIQGNVKGKFLDMNQDTEGYDEQSEELDDSEVEEVDSEQDNNPVRYYDEEDPSTLYQKNRRKRKRSQENSVDKGIIRLNPPKLLIKANRSEIIINRKILAASTDNTIENINEIESSRNKSNTINSSKMDTLLKQHKMSDNKDIGKYIDSQESSKDEKSEQKQFYSYSLKPTHSRKQASLSQEKNKLINQTLENTPQTERRSSKLGSSVLKEITQTPVVFSKPFNNASIKFSAKVPDKNISFSKAQEKISKQYEELFFKDMKLESQFNKKVVLNINLFKSDLERYRLPNSISTIFSKKAQNMSINNSMTEGNISTQLPILNNKIPNFMGSFDKLDLISKQHESGLDSKEASSISLINHMNIKNSMNKRQIQEVAEIIKQGSISKVKKDKAISQSNLKNLKAYCSSIDSIFQKDSMNEIVQSINSTLTEQQFQSVDSLNESLLSKQMPLNKRQQEKKHFVRQKKQDDVIFRSNLDIKQLVDPNSSLNEQTYLPNIKSNNITQRLDNDDEKGEDQHFEELEDS